MKQFILELGAYVAARDAGTVDPNMMLSTTSLLVAILPVQFYVLNKSTAHGENKTTPWHSRENNFDEIAMNLDGKNSALVW